MLSCPLPNFPPALVSATWVLQKSIKHSEIKHKIQKNKIPVSVEKAGQMTYNAVVNSLCSKELHNKVKQTKALKKH
jgi:hypothetical protein